ncbi:MAG: ABC transporter permease [Parvularculaceae bacterium]
MSIALQSSAPPEVARPVFGERRFGAVNWLGLATLTKREIRRFMKVAFQTIVAPLVSTALFLVVFMQAFGATRAPIHGVPYAEFLAPGLVMMAVLTNAFANSSSSLIIGKVQGSIVDVLMPPLSPSELGVALAVGAAARGVLVGVVAAITCAAFMAMSGAPMRIVNPWALVYFMLAGSFMFGFLGIIGGIWADKFDQLAAATNFVITPLTFLSGTFYAIKNLPEPFLTLSSYNPVFYLIDGFRYGFTGVFEISPMRGVYVTLALNIVLAIVCRQLLKSGYKLKS